MLIDGKEVARRITDALKERIEFVTDCGLPRPMLAIITVGNNPSSAVYVRQKLRVAADIEIDTLHMECEEDSSIEEIQNTIRKLNINPEINGIILQLPLPDHFTKDEVRALIDTIDPTKDVDGLTTTSIGRLRSGDTRVFEPCTAAGIVALLAQYCGSVKGKVALVVGRSDIVGKPVADLLMREGATVICAHSKTPHSTLVGFAKSADVIVCATGKPGVLAPDEVNRDAVIIDVGITRVDGEATDTSIKQMKSHLVGDLYPTVNENHCRAITPVPGGVGPMTVAMLMNNVYEAYARQNEI